MGLSAILFDFGHTLMDFTRTEEALHGAYTVIRDRLANWVEDRAPPEIDELVERIAAEIDRQVERSYHERRLEELDQIALFEEAFAALGYKLPQDLLREVAELDNTALVNSVRMDPETVDIIEKLRAEGFKVGLVSNVAITPHLLWQNLEQFGLRHLMDGVSFSSEVGVRKPRPQIFEHCLNQLGVAPRDAVFVGDRLVDDIAGAQAVGMRAVLTQQYRQEEPDAIKPDAMIKHIGELPDIISRWSHLDSTAR